mmetsp:Transcript_14714/g.50808  ORF Transcript_14714/g.50808 Transcript_14714/m.50808 type:complete len:221 (-) Transcript_14714:252-914(-)
MNVVDRLPASLAHSKVGGVGAQTAQHVPVFARASAKTSTWAAEDQAPNAPGSSRRGVTKPISRDVCVATTPHAPNFAAARGAQASRAALGDQTPPSVARSSPTGTAHWSTAKASRGDAVDRSTAPESDASTLATTPSRPAAASRDAPGRAHQTGATASTDRDSSAFLKLTPSPATGGFHFTSNRATMDARCSESLSLRQSNAKTYPSFSGLPTGSDSRKK